MCFNQRGNISTLNSSSLKLEGKFTYLGSSVSLTETDFDTRLAKAETAIDWLLVIFKSDITDKIKRSFFQSAVVSILLYGCTTWTLNKEKMLDGNYTRMQRAILNKSWKQHPTKKQLYGYLPLVTKTIKVRRTRRDDYFKFIGNSRQRYLQFKNDLKKKLIKIPVHCGELLTFDPFHRFIIIYIYIYIYIYIW